MIILFHTSDNRPTISLGTYLLSMPRHGYGDAGRPLERTHRNNVRPKSILKAAVAARTSSESVSSKFESPFESSSTTTGNEAVLAIPPCLSKSIPRIYKAVMRPLDLSFGLVREKKDEPLTNVRRVSRHVDQRANVKNTPRSKASVCFVVSQPGCVLSFEQGAALTDLITEFADHQVGAWGVVKEINVDDNGLLNLYQKHFNFPFFLDVKRALYGALGQQRISLSSLNLLFGLCRLRRRCRDKGIEDNLVGKGASMVLGGVIVFDRRGNIRYAYQDQIAVELPVDEIRAAIRHVVEEDTLGNGNRPSSLY